MKNQDIREAITQAGLWYWEVAERYGCCDCNFSKKLRRELPDTEKQKIYNIIAELVKERESA